MFFDKELERDIELLRNEVQKLREDNTYKAIFYFVGFYKEPTKVTTKMEWVLFNNVSPYRKESPSTLVERFIWTILEDRKEVESFIDLLPHSLRIVDRNGILIEDYMIDVTALKYISRM